MLSTSSEDQVTIIHTNFLTNLSKVENLDITEPESDN